MSKLNIWTQWCRTYIDFNDSEHESGDDEIAKYLGIQLEDYKKKLIEFGAYNKSHGSKSTFFLHILQAREALEWVRFIEIGNKLAGV